MWNIRTSDCECNKACKIDGYLDIKNRSCEKRLFCKLALACEDEILNTTETSLDDKKIKKIKKLKIAPFTLVILSIIIYHLY